MSFPESTHVPTDLHASIEQLIAHAVQGSRTRNDDRLETVLRETLVDIETQQKALAVMVARIRTVLDDAIVTEEIGNATAEVTIVDEPAAPLEITQSAERGPHEIDIIAHGTTLASASGIQTLLRGMPQVTDLQTRQFVNGELRLHATMASAIDAAAFSTWLATHHGSIGTFTDDVIEIEFADKS